MFEEARTILESLHKRKYEAFYIGGKCRNELHNKLNLNSKIEVKDIDIVTNATLDEIVKIFPNSSVRGESFQVAAVNFGGFEFEVATYRKDIYDKDELKNSKKVARPKTEIVKDLDEDRLRRDFTCNAVAEDIDGEYIDFVYVYRNKKISAIKDIENKTIRAIGNPRQRFEEDPLRIIRAFRFASQLGYEIEKQTLKAISNNLNLLSKIPHERIGTEINKLVTGRYAYDVLKLMKEMGIFDVTIFNSIQQQDVKILPLLNEISEFDDLKILNSDGNSSVLETWTVLLRPLGAQKAKESLRSIQALNCDDIEKVEWLINHFDIINSNNIKQDIYDARDGIVKRHKLMCMRELLKTLIRIYCALYGDNYKKIGEKVMDAFCGRPYFEEQLKIDGNKLMEIAGEGPGPWISMAKEKLIYKLIMSDKFPKDEEKYLELTQEAVEETLFEQTMKEEGLI